MAFFTFSQNNSGGIFYEDNRVAKYVIIEADNASEANDLAEERAGIYFDGCDLGYDCECCGDRWYPAWNDYAGKSEPLIYGKSAFKYGKSAIIYYKNGTIVHPK